MRALRTTRVGMVVALALATAGACTYSPNFNDGLLGCGLNGECPKGYACAPDNTCAKDSGGSGNGNPQFNTFIGTWSFASGTLSGSCTDGSTLNATLTPDDFIVISARGSNLGLEYFCPTGWTMTLPATGTTATVASNQTCEQDTTDNAGVVTTFSWSAKSLTFTITALTATTNGRLSGPFSDTNNVTGTCDVTFNGALTKD